LLCEELRGGSLHDYADQMFGFDFIWEDREKLDEIKENLASAIAEQTKIAAKLDLLR
jgi:hypothetical protein